MTYRMVSLAELTRMMLERKGTSRDHVNHVHTADPSFVRPTVINGPFPVCGRMVRGGRRCVMPVVDGDRDQCPNRENHAPDREKRCEALRLGSVCRGALRSDGVCTASTEHDPLPVPVFKHTAEVVPFWIKVLDHHGVPRDAGRPFCARILRKHGYKIDTNVLADVVRERRHPW